MNKHPSNSGAGIHCFLLCIMVVASAAVCHARQKITPAPAPKPPLLATLPNPSAWTVKISNLGDRYRAKKVEKIIQTNPDADPEMVQSEIEEAHPDPAVADRDIRSISATYANGVRREVLVLRNGKSKERYLAARYYLFEHAREGRPVAIPAIDSDWMEYPMEANQFGEFEWLSRHHHIGQTTHAGRLCDVYQWESWRAFIDAETKLPVQLESMSSVRRYEFDPEPEKISVVLPEHYAEIIRKKLQPSRDYQKKYSVRKR